MTEEQLKYYRDIISNPTPEYEELADKSILQESWKRITSSRRKYQSVEKKARNRLHTRNWYYRHKTDYPKIYMILNDCTGEVYVGQTTNTLGKRLSQHKSMAKSGRTGPLYASIREFGGENFQIVKLYQCSEQDDPNSKEFEYINLQNAELNVKK